MRLVANLSMHVENYLIVDFSTCDDKDCIWSLFIVDFVNLPLFTLSIYSLVAMIVLLEEAWPWKRDGAIFGYFSFLLRLFAFLEEKSIKDRIAYK